VVVKALSVCGGCTDLAALPSLLRQLMRLAGLGQRALVLRVWFCGLGWGVQGAMEGVLGDGGNWGKGCSLRDMAAV
jgi:hypothetical protein